VGAVAAFLAGDWAKAVSGNTIVDAGYHIVA
jgi:enoyl-[acyl-carrier-protein] reductase (NADH)